MKKLAIATAAALLTIGTPAVAQVTSFNPRTVIPHFDKESLDRIAAQVGPSKTEWRQIGDGEQTLVITMESGVMILVKPSGCGSGRCVGLSLTGLWQKDEGESDASIHAKLAEFNDTAVPTAFLYSNGLIALTQYVIADYGMPQGNIVETLKVFDAYAQRLSQQI